MSPRAVAGDLATLVVLSALLGVVLSLVVTSAYRFGVLVRGQVREILR